LGRFFISDLRYLGWPYQQTDNPAINDLKPLCSASGFQNLKPAFCLLCLAHLLRTCSWRPLSISYAARFFVIAAESE